jgi:class 3 adenylate cyclase/tetratricopeptide (TPR) repeat protein
VTLCPSCRAESSGGRFCAACGTPLHAPRARRRERRLVTALFCDLVGFTAQSEVADPEDLDRMLGAYAAMTRAAVERHGGIVEKFIGDAVVGVFGIPIAHEDDPARAVRAGLEICAGAAALRTATGQPLRLRVGVNTGEALAHLDVDAEAGEHIVVGDTVNTAARIQSAAPEQGVAVGLQTWEATRIGFAYDVLPPAMLKGKAEPVRMFHARSERVARGMDANRIHAGAYVGRRRELETLLAAFDDVRVSRKARLALITGEAGIGKSRILTEIAGSIPANDPTASWLQGRCLPYGDGLGFWALGEIVKTRAGIREGDDAAVATTKLVDMLDGAPDTGWLQDRLLPLLGLATGAPAGREEQFSAWRRFLEGTAVTGPAIIVFEDVHWADPALLAFIDELAATADAALLIVVTARPTVFELAPSFATVVPNVIRVDLGALDEKETGELVVDLLGSIIPADLHGQILRLSEGNPLYAEELVRLLQDRDLLERHDDEVRLRPGATVPLPSSIHALIAARLDTLDEAARSVIFRAAVIGATFWPGAVSAVGDPLAPDLADVLASLQRRQLIRRRPESSMQGESEFAFWHVLTRDVAYASQPREARMAAHLAAASWIRDHGGRQEDVAGLVAHHLVTALGLATVATDEAAVSRIRPDARDALVQAASSALAIDPLAAASLYRRALDLTDPVTDARAQLLLRYGEAAERSSLNREALEAFETALAFYTERDDREGVARTMIAMRPVLGAIQDPRWAPFAREAARILEDHAPSPLLVDALSARARSWLWDWSWDRALEDADRAIDLAARLDLAPPASALGIRGWARLATQEPGGMEDCERAIELSVDAGDWNTATWVMTNYATFVMDLEGVPGAIEITRRAIEMCDGHGLRAAGDIHRSGLAGELVDAGRFDEALGVIAVVLPSVEASGEIITEAWVSGMQARIAVARGEPASAAPLVRRILAISDAHREQDDLNPPRIDAAVALAATGRSDEAARLLEWVVTMPQRGVTYEAHIAPATRLALQLGRLDLADAAIDRTDASSHLQVTRAGVQVATAMIAEARGDIGAAGAGYRTAVKTWRDLGCVVEAGFADLGAGRCLASLGDIAGATERFAVARATFEQVGAGAWLDAVRSAEASVGIAGRT